MFVFLAGAALPGILALHAPIADFVILLHCITYSSFKILKRFHRLDAIARAGSDTLMISHGHAESIVAVTTRATLCFGFP